MTNSNHQIMPAPWGYERYIWKACVFWDTVHITNSNHQIMPAPWGYERYICKACVFRDIVHATSSNHQIMPAPSLYERYIGKACLFWNRVHMTSSIWFLAEPIQNHPAAPRKHLLRLAGVSLSESFLFFYYCSFLRCIVASGGVNKFCV